MIPLRDTEAPNPWTSSTSQQTDLEASQQRATNTQFQQADKVASKPWTDSELLSGFPQTAHFLAADPDKSAVIFRRFDKVSIRNLLYLEGRIAALETLQDDLDKEDKNDHSQDDDVAAAAASWEDFELLGSTGWNFPKVAGSKWKSKRLDRIEALERERTKHSQGKSNLKSPASTSSRGSDLVEQRWQVAKAIRNAVKEYQEALLLYSRLLSLKGPAKRSRQTVADWFKGVYTNPKTGERQEIRETPQFYEDSAMSDIFERGLRTSKHSERTPNDLVSLRSPADDDFISKMIANSRLTFKALKNKAMSDSEIIYVPEKRIHKTVILIELLAALDFLIAAIWALWGVRNKFYVVKLGVLTAFVAAFGMWISLATSATKSEIFAATAAYAAVLVVYVGK